VIYEVLWRTVPYEGIEPCNRNFLEISNFVVHLAVAMEREQTMPHLPSHPDHVELSDVMKLCTSYSPKERPNFKDICAFLSSIIAK
jgi:hypothetical protein